MGEIGFCCMIPVDSVEFWVDNERCFRSLLCVVTVYICNYDCDYDCDFLSV